MLTLSSLMSFNRLLLFVKAFVCISVCLGSLADTILFPFFILLIYSSIFFVCTLHAVRWWVGLCKVEVQTFVATFVCPYCAHAHKYKSNCSFFFHTDSYWTHSDLGKKTRRFLRKTQNTTYDYRVPLLVQHFHQKRPWPWGFVIASCRKRNVTSWHHCQCEWQKTLPLCCCLCRALSLWD